MPHRKEYLDRFDKVDENIYYEKINNQVDLYLYPVNKTKNFYITLDKNLPPTYNK